MLAALVFLSVNGVESLPPPDALEEMTMRVASGEASKGDLTDWMRIEIRPESAR